MFASSTSRIQRFQAHTRRRAHRRVETRSVSPRLRAHRRVPLAPCPDARGCCAVVRRDRGRRAQALCCPHAVMTAYRALRTRARSALTDAFVMLRCASSSYLHRSTRAEAALPGELVDAFQTGFRVRVLSVQVTPRRLRRYAEEATPSLTVCAYSHPEIRRRLRDIEVTIPLPHPLRSLVLPPWTYLSLPRKTLLRISLLG